MHSLPIFPTGSTVSSFIGEYPGPISSELLPALGACRSAKDRVRNSEEPGDFGNKAEIGLPTKKLGLLFRLFPSHLFLTSICQYFDRAQTRPHRMESGVLELTLGRWASACRNMVWLSAQVARGPRWCTGSSFRSSEDQVLWREEISKLIASGPSHSRFFPRLLAIWIETFPYSTVTLFARFRGLSTSQPRSTAI